MVIYVYISNQISLTKEKASIKVYPHTYFSNSMLNVDGPTHPLTAEVNMYAVQCSAIFLLCELVLNYLSCYNQLLCYRKFNLECDIVSGLRSKLASMYDDVHD